MAVKLTEFARDGRIELAANPDAVAGARRYATGSTATAGTSADTSERVALAVSEAVTNAVTHAYIETDGDGPIEVELLLDDHYLVVYVRDRGRGMVPRLDSPGLGFGLPLLGRVADRVELSSVDGHGTEVCMRFGLSEHG
jgi:anti-sigma regulatory factor (Ser/Thr protein kinase)